MSSASTNVNRSTDAADYINWLKLYAQTNQLAGTGGTNLQPMYLIGLGNTIDITDSVTTNPHNQSLANTEDITDSVSETDYPAGASNLAGNAFKKLWLQFNNDVLDNSTNGNDGTITYHSNLKGLWFFSDYGSLNDATSGANNLTVTGNTIYKRGKEGTAFSFDGSSYLSGAVTGLPLTTTDRSFSFWIKTTSTFTDALRIFEYGVNSGRQLFSIRYSGTSGKIALFDGTTSYASTGTLSQNAWNYVTVTVGSVGTSLKIYISGVLDSTTTITALNTSTSNLFIGADITGGNKLPSSTLINQARLYNITISLTQVQSLYMVGVIGSCHTFDGGEIISLGNVSSLSFERTQSLTFVCWVKTTVNGSQILFSKFFNVTTGYLFGLSGNGLQFQMSNTNNSNDFTCSCGNTTGTIYDGNWHQVAITYQGDSNPANVKFYIDGVSQTTVVVRNNLSASILNSNPVIIGALDAVPNNIFTGQIDDIQVWIYVLSQTEINYLFAKKDGWQVEDDADFQPLWLSFDNDYVDKSGNNNAGTLTGTETYVAGPKTIKAFSFNGTTYVNYGNPANLNFERTRAFSISFWMKASLGSAFQSIFGKFLSLSTGIFVGQGGSSNNIQFQLANTNNSNDLVVFGGNPFDNTWHHFVITYDGSSVGAGVKMYQDGVSQTISITRNNLSASILNSANVFVGSLDGTNNDFSGSISDLQVWNYVLSQTDVNTLLGGQQIAHNPVVPTPAKSDFCEVVA